MDIRYKYDDATQHCINHISLKKEQIISHYEEMIRDERLSPDEIRNHMNNLFRDLEPLSNELIKIYERSSPTIIMEDLPKYLFLD